MSLLASPRRRRILFAALALVAGGYVSYRVYNSSALGRKRKQLIQTIGSLSYLFESVSQSAECFSIISKDLKSFLLSDGESVPRSLRQAFKVGQCPEFQETVTVLSAALTQGLLRGLKGNAVIQGREGASMLEGRHGRQLRKVNRGSQNHPSEDAACREIREVGFPAVRREVKRGTEILEDDGCLECEEKREVILSEEVVPSVEKGFECQMEINLSGPESQLVSGKKTDLLFDRVSRGQAENMASHDLPERLLAKLFSEPGVGFASAVVGSLARNCVIALFDSFQNRPSEKLGPLVRGHVYSEIDSRPAETQPTDRTTSTIVDVLFTDGGRTLIAECIQNFVSTAVSVYIDKTKDVNFYDDMVAGITNPSHRAPMKDVLTSVCNGAVETLVRTTHEVMFSRNSLQAKFDDSYLHHQEVESQAGDSSEPGIESSCTGKDLNMDNQLPILSSMINYEVKATGNTLHSFESNPCSSGTGEACEANAQSILNPNTEHYQVKKALQKIGRKSSDMQSFIVGLSKTLAIPSNRQLVVDVAGTMTSEAIRSFAAVVTSTVSSYFSTKSKQGCNSLKSGVSEQIENQACQLQTKSRMGMTDAAMKAFLLATICLAICLHVLAGVHGLENVQVPLA